MDKLSDRSSEDVANQASLNTEDRFKFAVKKIDSVFGGGYSQAHPELVGALVASSTREFAATLIAQRMEKLTDEVQKIALVIRDLPDHLFTVNVSE